jgi:hypothetical protein
MLWRLWLWIRNAHHRRLLDYSLLADEGVNLASGVARLITRLARSTPDARVRDEYWNAAIGIVDELCDVGAPTRSGRGIQPDRLAQLASARSGHQEATGQNETFLPPYLIHW